MTVTGRRKHGAYEVLIIFQEKKSRVQARHPSSQSEQQVQQPERIRVKRLDI
jgi:hypothetical protein